MSTKPKNRADIDEGLEPREVAPAPASNAPILCKVSVEELFGRYSYSIPEHPLGTLPGEYDRLILLYGENGSGKTTILRLVFHLLSPLDRKGHRTYISGVPFRRLTVELGSGTVISAVRSGADLSGDFEVLVQDPDGSTRIFPIYVDDDGSLDESRSAIDDLVAYLTELAVYPYYLTDSRLLVGDTLKEDDRGFTTATATYQQRISGRVSRHFEEFVDQFSDDMPREVRQTQELASALRRAQRWIQQQAYRQTSNGIAGSSNVYLEVLQALASGLRRSTDEALSRDKGSVQDRLESLALRSEEYAQYGIGTPFPANRFLTLLDGAPPDRKIELEDALEPHVDSIEIQQAVLKELYELLVTFVTGANDFFTDKTLSFRAGREGITIRTTDGRRLDPSHLSSGEKQLLLLLCNTLVARDDSKLFIIDEPELSLNVTWQRNLLDLLLALTTGTKVQFFIATHSIEMVSGHRESLARLVNAEAE